MKKLSILTLVLVLGLFSTPAMAALSMSCATSGVTVTVSYTGNGVTAATRARAFALDISIDGADVGTEPAGDSTADYYVYPGSIDIDETTGAVDDWGSPVAAGGAGSSSMTTEQGSLYDALDTSGHTTPPGAAGTLLVFSVPAGSDLITITENASRSGVVMEDGSSAGLSDPICTCTGPATTCWNATECPGQPIGDSTCDGKIDFDDLGDLSAAFGFSKGMPGFNCCVDYDHDGSINFTELGLLSANFGATGLGGTGNTNCPP